MGSYFSTQNGNKPTTNQIKQFIGGNLNNSNNQVPFYKPTGVQDGGNNPYVLSSDFQTTQMYGGGNNPYNLSSDFQTTQMYGGGNNPYNLSSDFQTSQMYGGGNNPFYLSSEFTEYSEPYNYNNMTGGNTHVSKAKKSTHINYIKLGGMNQSSDNNTTSVVREPRRQRYLKYEGKINKLLGDKDEKVSEQSGGHEELQNIRQMIENDMKGGNSVINSLSDFLKSDSQQNYDLFLQGGADEDDSDDSDDSDDEVVDKEKIKKEENNIDEDDSSSSTSSESSSSSPDEDQSSQNGSGVNIMPFYSTTSK